MVELRSPYPWFGGKYRAAALIWAALGDVPNYVEPFFGGGAVLLARPHDPRIETVNDLDSDVANFWRAVGWPDPVIRHKRTMQVAEIVAAWADYPVSEVDLHARHRWLVERLPVHRERMRRDPKYFSPERAGWWVWGLCQWIGSGWCAEPENGKRPDLAKRGSGVVSKRAHARGNLEWSARPGLHTSNGVHGRRVRDIANASEWQKRPVSAQRGSRGVTGRIPEQMPSMGTRGSRGVTGRISKQIPDINGNDSAAGRGVHASGKRGGLYDWMRALAARMRHVRVVCGDFERILGPSATTAIGVTGVLLDPPYSAEAGRDPSLYSEEDLKVAHRARDWALKHGDDPKMRIVLCGYQGEHDMPASWRCVPWKAVGGYAAAAGNTENAHRERLWLSPHCLDVEAVRAPQMALFSEDAA